jgi:hypothetical protein
VTLIHSLEHVPNPLAALQAATQRLREGGQLLIEVPHAGSFEMFRPGRRRFIMSLPGHLHHFTPANLARLLKKAGMKTVCVDVRNPDVLEWLLARRADLKRFVGARTGAPSVEAESVTRSSRAGYSRRVWCNAVLPFLRTRFPGWSFAMVACRAASNDFETATSTACESL